VIRLSPEAEFDLLNHIAGMIDGGELKICSASGQVLASLEFSRTWIADGRIAAELEQAPAIESGRAVAALVLDRGGRLIFDADAGTDGGAAITLNTAEIRKGGPVTIRSFSFGLRR
jgi:hypothetical protein